MESKRWPAAMEYLDEAMQFIDERMEQSGFGEDARRHVAMAFEELFTNIASYAYETDGGTVEIGCGMKDAVGDGAEALAAALVIRFVDHGKPFDPFAAEDPDLTLPIEERPIGGLGIFMVKKFMDQVRYSREGDCNVTEIVKYRK